MKKKRAIFYWIPTFALLAPQIYVSSLTPRDKADTSFSTATEQASVPANQLRFPVAHLHVGAWCRGYLYINEEGIRYEVVRPEKGQGALFSTPTFRDEGGSAVELIRSNPEHRGDQSSPNKLSFLVASK